uniref:Cnidarian restricted protein n=1 Tax=Clytia hemisphaerica TaxID=252671 RepID=A0A7M5X9W4_9CNID
MDIKVLILFTAVLAIAYSYRISNDDSNTGRNFYQALQDMIDDRVAEKMDPKHECKFGGLCNNVYSYGCHKYVKKCDGPSGCTEIGTCWRQCYSNSKTWCRLSDEARRDKFFSCQKDSDCAYTREKGLLGKPAGEVCEIKYSATGSGPICHGSKNPLTA